MRENSTCQSRQKVPLRNLARILQNTLILLQLLVTSVGSWPTSSKLRRRDSSPLFSWMIISSQTQCAKSPPWIRGLSGQHLSPRSVRQSLHHGYMVSLVRICFQQLWATWKEWTLLILLLLFSLQPEATLRRRESTPLRFSDVTPPWKSGVPNSFYNFHFCKLTSGVGYKPFLVGSNCQEPQGTTKNRHMHDSKK